jgi:hypothetical protein
MEIELVTVHLFTLLCTALVIIHADHQGFLYFRGKKQTLSAASLQWSHRLVWGGLLLMITTGILLALPAWEYLLREPVFLLKMGFVSVLVINAFAIGKLSAKAAEIPFSSLSKKEQHALLVSGALSFCGWVGAATIGIFFL